MSGILDENAWAYQAFNRAQLGDKRLVARLISMGEQAARTPAGQITAGFRDAAQREGAFRFVENRTRDLSTGASRRCGLMGCTTCSRFFASRRPRRCRGFNWTEAE